MSSINHFNKVAIKPAVLALGEQNSPNIRSTPIINHIIGQLNDVVNSENNAKDSAAAYSQIVAILAETHGDFQISGLRAALREHSCWSKVSNSYFDGMKSYEVTLAETLRENSLEQFIRHPGKPDLLAANLREYKALELNGPTEIIYIGCGAVPFGALNLALFRNAQNKGLLGKIEKLAEIPTVQALSAARGVLAEGAIELSALDLKIKCLDSDPSMIAAAKELISRFRMERFFTFESANACEMRSLYGSHIILAAAVSPKLQAIRTMLSREATERLVVRTISPEHPYSIFADLISEEDLKVIDREFTRFSLADRWEVSVHGTGAMVWTKGTVR